MSDALERLRSRNRPTVPLRDASLAPAVLASMGQDPSTNQDESRTQDISTSRNLEVQVSNNLDIPKSIIQESLKPLQTKQTTLRIESDLSDRLQDLCRDNGICREVLIEAMFEYCEENGAALEAVLTEARVKNEHRQQLANQKRAKSMMQRFGQVD